MGESLKQADQRVAQALQAVSEGRVRDAETLLGEVLQSVPDHAIASHWLGILCFQRGAIEQGLQLVRRSLELKPDCSSWFNDLGNMLVQAEQLDQALPAFIAALELDPSQSLVWNNLGAAFQRLQRLDDALTAFESAVRLDEYSADALYNLANVQSLLGLGVQAGINQCRAFVLPPYEGKSKQLLAMAYYVLGRQDQAAESYRQWLLEEPGNPIAIHMLAASTAQNVPERASDAYLQQYFDQAAEQFDSKMLESLAYCVPYEMGQILPTLTLLPQTAQILDAGCGTGLCGRYLKPYAHTLTGVDLSAKSLDYAADKQCYDRLEQTEIVDYMRCTPVRFDLIVSADTLIYLGVLEAFFAAASACLIPAGHLLVSAESFGGPDSYVLTPSGRYAHSQNYLLHCARQAGLALRSLEPVVLRVELGKPVAGWIMLAMKSA